MCGPCTSRYVIRESRVGIAFGDQPESPRHVPGDLVRLLLRRADVLREEDLHRVADSFADRDARRRVSLPLQEERGDLELIDAERALDLLSEGGAQEAREVVR